MLHLDLLVLLAFSISLAFFENAQHRHVGAARLPAARLPAGAHAVDRVPARARPRRREPLRLLVPSTWLAVAIVFLIGFRVGPERHQLQRDRRRLLGGDRRRPPDRRQGRLQRSSPPTTSTATPTGRSTTTPTYRSSRLWPWSGTWDDLPAAHFTAVWFDLPTLLLLWLLGRRIRGPTLGIALAYGWAAFPFTLFTLESNANDSLVAMLVVLTLLVVRRPAARGAAGALAGLSKFAPLGLAPLLATYDAARERVTLRPRVLRPSSPPSRRRRRSCCCPWPWRRAACAPSMTARWATRAPAARRSRSGACTAGSASRRRRSRSAACCWRCLWPSCPAGATS